MASREIAKIGKSGAKFICDLVPHCREEFVTDETFALTEDGKALAVWTYTPRGKQHWEITIASITPKWCSHRVIKFIFHYGFAILGAVRLTAQCLASNIQARKTLPRFGFLCEGKLRSYFNGQDVLIYSRLRTD